MTREEALAKLEEPPYAETLAMQDLEYVAKKLNITNDEFIDLMGGENKTFRDYKSNFRLIEAAVKIARLVGYERRLFR